MAVTPAGGSNSNAAALAAQRAREAQEARERAEAAARKAREAQKNAKKARDEAQQAKAAQGNAQQNVTSAERNLNRTRDRLEDTTDHRLPVSERRALQRREDRQEARLERATDRNERLQTDVTEAEDRLTTARSELDAANARLQTAEERVIDTASDADRQMRDANAIARSEGKPPPFARNELRANQIKESEAVDAIDGSTAGRRNEIQEKLGTRLGANNTEVQSAIANQERFDELQRDPELAGAMRDLEIQSGQDLQGFGERLAREAEGRNGGLERLDLKNFSDPAALNRLISESGQTLTGRARGTVTDPFFSEMVSLGKSPEKMAKMNPSERALEVYEAKLDKTVQKPLSEWNEEDAERFTGALADEMERYQDSPEMMEALMTASGQRLQRATQIIGDAGGTDTGLKEDAIENLSANLSRIGNAAPDAAAARLAYMTANEMDGNSELGNVDDGFGQVENTRFRDLVAGALATQDKGDAAEELVEKGASGFDLGDVGGFLADKFGDAAGAIGEAFSDAANAVEEGASDAFNFLSEKVVGQFGDAVRNKIVDLMNVEGAINRLKSPGDSSAVEIGVEGNLAGIELGVGASVKFTKTENGGYEMELMGKGSAALASALQVPGLAEAEAELEGSASASFKFSFDNKEEAIAAAETVAGVSAGVGMTAAGGPLAPVGAAMVASSTEEVGNVVDNFESTTLKVGAQATLSGELGRNLGLEATAGASVAVEIDKDGNTDLLLGTHAELSGEFSSGSPIPIPGGGNFTASQLRAQASLEMETRIPIDTGAIGDFFTGGDPAQAIEDLGEEAYNNAESTLKGSFQFEGGIRASGRGAGLNGMGGVQVQFSATAKTKDLAGALPEIATGNMQGALSELGRDVHLTGDVRGYRDVEVGVGNAEELVDGDANTETEGEGVSLGPIGSVEITAAYASRQSEIIAEFGGGPGQIGRDFRGFLNAAKFNS